MSKLRVKFTIDKEQQRVIFAEAGSDFVDVLLSFLTLPLGSIVRLLGKKSGLGSLDSLYESVEMLDEKYLNTKACKEMLLNPRSAAAIICEDLKLKNIHDSNPRDFYYCNLSGCISQSTCYYTFVENIKCSRCGTVMTKKGFLPKNTLQEGGIFVNETIDFLITDNLRVMPISLMAGFSILKEMGIKDTSTLEERVTDFGTEEALKLLRKSLVSKNPLTEICFPDACVQASVNCSLAIKEELIVAEKVSETILKLILNMKKNEVLYAEAGEHFFNQLLNFLTFPLGSVLKLMSDNVSALAGCINNLYSSVENMSLDCFKSENCRNLLMTPKLATFYGLEQQILNLEEITSQKLSICKSSSSFYYQGALHYSEITFKWHQSGGSEFIEQNPKLEKAVAYNCGAYMLNSRRLMVDDNLRVSPLSFNSAINIDMNLSISDIVGKEVYLDKAKVLLLLCAMLISKTVLTDVFWPKPI